MVLPLLLSVQKSSDSEINGAECQADVSISVRENSATPPKKETARSVGPPDWKRIPPQQNTRPEFEKRKMGNEAKRRKRWPGGMAPNG
jgi:hypothetical protein